MHKKSENNKDRVKRKTSHLMLLFSYNLLTCFSRSPHEIEAKTTTSVDPLFFGLRIELWDSKMVEEIKRDDIFCRNLTFRFLFFFCSETQMKRVLGYFFFPVILNYKINFQF